MPRKRDPETGEPIDVPSSYVDKPPQPRRDGPARPARSEETPGPPRPSVVPFAPASAGQAGPSPLDAPTEWLRDGRPKAGEGPGDVDRHTRLIRPGRGTEEARRKGSEEAATPGGPGAPEAADPMADPVTGWLVVIAGPGKGRVCRLGNGANSLGRGEGARVRIDFGDDGISREGHAVLTYDPRGRKYYLQHGGGVNLTYLGDEPVLAPTPLAPMQVISLGATTLRFVPLCGPDFDWQDLEDAGGA